jgi:hypothetical protein
MKPKAYLPILAPLPPERKASRPWTYATLIGRRDVRWGRSVGLSGDLPHEDCAQHLEEESNHVQKPGQIGTDASAKGQDAGKEGADGKEETDEDKGEHESGEEEEFPRAEKLFGHPILGVKGPSTGRVKGVGRVDAIAGTDGAAAVAVAVIPKRPSGDRWSIGDTGGISLKKVDLVGGRGVDCAGQEC